MNQQLLVIAWLAPLLLLPLVYSRFAGRAMAVSAARPSPQAA